PSTEVTCVSARDGCHLKGMLLYRGLALYSSDTSREQSGRGNMPNTSELSGRSAVVTGGAQGIGKAIVERFLDSGAAVAIWDRDRKLADETADELKARNRVAAFPVDVTKLAEVEKARDATKAAFGRIDILVN